MIIFTTESKMEFESREDFEAMIQMMPWTPEEKEAFFTAGVHEETDEVEIDGAESVEHKFTYKEV